MPRRSHLRRPPILLLIILALSGSVVSADAGPLAVPGQPLNVQASDGTFVDKIRVTWNATAGATRYQVYRALRGSDTWTQLFPNPTASPFDDTSVFSDYVYDYRVTACNSEGCGLWSWPADSGYLGVGTPTNVQASDGAYTTKIRVTWNASQNAGYYQVYRGVDAAGYQGSPVSVYGALYYDDANATPGVLYYYWVKGCNVNECSPFSSDDTGYRALSSPTDVQASDGVYCPKTRVIWGTVTGATSYTVRRGNTSNSYNIEWTGITNTYYDDYSGSGTTRYWYSVLACASTGCSLTSNADDGYRDVPSAPGGIFASDGTFANRVNIHWTGVAGATYYRLQRGPSPGIFDTTIDNITETSYDDYTASPGVTYYYRVASCASCGCGSPGSADTGSRMASTATPTATRTATPGPSPTATRTATPGPSPTASRTPTFGVWLPLVLKAGR